MLAESLVDRAEVGQAVGLPVAVAELAVDGEALLQAGDGLVILPRPPVDLAEAGDAVGLPVAGTQLPADGEAFL